MNKILEIRSQGNKPSKRRTLFFIYKLTPANRVCKQRRQQAQILSMNHPTRLQHIRLHLREDLSPVIIYY